MPKEFSRAERVAELIQRKLAKLIQLELTDPRLSSFVTVSHVKVSKDFAHANVYISSLTDDKTIIDDSLAALESAAGFLRKKLGADIKLRLTPELHFLYDDTLVYGNRLSKLIDGAIEQDNDKDDQ